MQLVIPPLQKIRVRIPNRHLPVIHRKAVNETSLIINSLDVAASLLTAGHIHTTNRTKPSIRLMHLLFFFIIHHRTVSSGLPDVSDTQMLADSNKTAQETDSYANSDYHRGQRGKYRINRQEIQQSRQYGKLGPDVFHYLIVQYINGSQRKGGAENTDKDTFKISPKIIAP